MHPKPAPRSKRRSRKHPDRLVTPSLAAFYEFAASKPCVLCGRSPVHLHHCRGAVSPKTGLELPRKKGIARALVVPLCAEHHEREHSNPLPHDEPFLPIAASLLAEYVTGGDE